MALVRPLGPSCERPDMHVAEVRHPARIEAFEQRGAGPVGRAVLPGLSARASTLASRHYLMCVWTRNPLVQGPVIAGPWFDVSSGSSLYGINRGAG